MASRERGLVSRALTGGEALIVEVSAALAGRREAALEAALRAALDGGASPEGVEEALLQAYLFLGYPAALEAFGLWREISGRPAAAPSGGDLEGWGDRGEAVCRRVYRGQYERLRANVSALHADLAEWMVLEGYGKVLGRPGLQLRVRELCIVALLAVLDAPRQLHSHLRGALHTGASVEQVDEALARALRHTGSEEARRRAVEVWQAVRARWEAAERTRSPQGEA
jgi:4-carboxymuconolactone decarboxylase